MHKALRLSTLALVGATAAGVIGFTAPAMADDLNDVAFKRDDDSGQVVTTKDGGDDDGDDDSTSGSTNTNTNTNGGTNTGTNTGGNGTNTGTRTRGNDTDHSRVKKVNDLTNDGPGNNNVDHSRGHTNDGTRNNTRG